MNTQLLYLVGGLAALTGFLTLSKTFLVGILVVLGISAWPNLKFPKRLFWLGKTIAFGGVVVSLVFVSFHGLWELTRGGLVYQIQQISTLELFHTRYNPEEGILADTFKAIIESLVIGHGAVVTEKAFIGDTLYITTLYMGGLVGLGIYLFFLYWVLKRSGAKRGCIGWWGLVNTLVFHLTILLMATGFGAPAFSTRRASECYWVLLGLSLNKNLMKSEGRCATIEK